MNRTFLFGIMIVLFLMVSCYLYFSRSDFSRSDFRVVEADPENWILEPGLGVNGAFNFDTPLEAILSLDKGYKQVDAYRYDLPNIGISICLVKNQHGLIINSFEVIVSNESPAYKTGDKLFRGRIRLAEGHEYAANDLSLSSFTNVYGILACECAWHPDIGAAVHDSNYEFSMECFGRFMAFYKKHGIFVYGTTTSGKVDSLSIRRVPFRGRVGYWNRPEFKTYYTVDIGNVSTRNQKLRRNVRLDRPPKDICVMHVKHPDSCCEVLVPKLICKESDSLVIITIDPSKFEANGQFVKKIQLCTDDEANPFINIYITGNICTW